jgi:hypothetical protein
MPIARPFAYYPGGSGGSNLIQGTLQVGNLAVGVTASGYNSGVGGVRWWNGPDESLGYVIAHEVPLGNQPFNPAIGATSAYVGFWRSSALTENSFVDLSNWVNLRAGGTGGFSTGSQAKVWLNSNGYWTSYGGIVSSGLTMQLDAGDSSSYPGSGSTWYDIAGTQDNITLVNSPTYTSGTPAYFTFNGTTQRGTGSAANVVPSTAYTKSVWFYLNAIADNNLVSSSTGGHFMFFGAGTTTMYCGHANWPSYTVFPSATTFSLNTWYNATLTFNTTDGMVLYINGAQDSTYTANKSAHGGNGSTNIATFGGGNLLNGRIAKVYTYNRALSSSEVLINYNSDKAQFGL